MQKYPNRRGIGAIMKPVKTSIDDPIAVYFMEPDVIRAPGRIGMSIAPGKNDEDGEADDGTCGGKCFPYSSLDLLSNTPNYLTY